jgi:aminocarboxymuconate-semialdehyde decarboxylase
MIPHFAGRLGSYLEDWGPKFDPAFRDCLQTLRKPLIDYFRMIYVDTALYQSPHSIHCVLQFFGTDHVLFGTDTPFDPERGSFVADAIAAIKAVQQDKRARNQIFKQNAIRILGHKRLGPAI